MMKSPWMRMPTFLQFCVNVARLLDRRAFLDVLEDLRIARFKPNNEQTVPASAIAFRVS